MVFMKLVTTSQLITLYVIYQWQRMFGIALEARMCLQQSLFVLVSLCLLRRQVLREPALLGDGEPVINVVWGIILLHRQELSLELPIVSTILRTVWRHVVLRPNEYFSVREDHPVDICVITKECLYLCGISY
jgi:hypothetical protein